MIGPTNSYFIHSGGARPARWGLDSDCFQPAMENNQGACKTNHERPISSKFITAAQDPYDGPLICLTRLSTCYLLVSIHQFIELNEREFSKESESKWCPKSIQKASKQDPQSSLLPVPKTKQIFSRAVFLSLLYFSCSFFSSFFLSSLLSR